MSRESFYSQVFKAIFAQKTNNTDIANTPTNETPMKLSTIEEEIEMDLESIKVTESDIKQLTEKGYVKKDYYYHNECIKIHKKEDFKFSNLEVEVLNKQDKPTCKWRKEFCLRRNRKFILNNGVYSISFYKKENVEKAMDIWMKLFTNELK